jgi:hypothetical protein
MAVVSPLNQPQTTDDGDQPDSAGTLASYLKGGPEGAALALMQQQRGAVGTEQQKLLDMMNQQQGPLSQTGMSDLDKASLMFQAAGALGQTTRSGGFGETLGNLGTSLAGPLSKAAEAQRQRQGQLQQLQLARQKLSVEMAGQQGVPAADMLSLIKSQRERVAAETEEPEYKDIKLGNGVTRTLKFIGNDAYDPVSGKKIDASTFNQQAQAESDLSGEDYLKTIPKDLAMEVQSLAAGRKPPKFGSRDAERTTATLTALRQYLGNDQEAYDHIMSGRRAQVAADITSDKPNTMGFAVTSAAKLMGHTDDAAKSAGNLENYDTPLLNRGRWTATSALGQSDIEKLREYNTTHNTASGEAARAIKGGVPSLGEVKEALSLSNPYMGPNEFQGHYTAIGKLLSDSVKPYMDRYNRVMGTNFTDTNDFLKKFAPSEGEHIENLRDLTVKGSNKWKQRQQEPQQAQPAAAPIAGAGQPVPTSQISQQDVAQGWKVVNGMRVRLKPGEQ